MPLDQLVPVLLIEIAVIVAVSRAVGYLFARFRQPLVVGEMVAGIMLGPSLLGWFSNLALRSGWLNFHLGEALFPPASVPFLGVLSQLGVIFFLFLVGLELDPKLLKKKGHTAVVISHASIVVPFLLGAGLTLFLYPRLFNETQAMKFTPVSLFIGAAMSITAFPVLARILTERNLHKTRIGVMAITCAAVDDVTAWCMLAFVIGVARAEGLMPALRTAGLSAAYVLAMFYLVRPFLVRLQSVHDRQGSLNAGAMAVVLGLVLLSAWTTEKIGIHALFGAFLMGTMMPKGSRFVRTLTEKLEDFVVILLLPIFFVFTGLKTEIGLLNGWDMWGYTALIILVACLGKFGGSAIAGRACGMGWREASVVGTLMNTRGLMELVILNVGRDLGVIPSAVFAMMVLMALTTTAMTAPVLHFLYPLRLYAAEVGAAVGTLRPRRKRLAPSVLIPVADPRSGASLLQLADLLTKPSAAQPADTHGVESAPYPSPAMAAASRRKIYALHLRRAVDKDAYQAASGSDGAIARTTTDAEVSLQPLLERAEREEIPVESIAFVSRDIAGDIVRTAVDRDVDLVLMGAHRPILGRKILSGAVHRVLREATSDVAIFVDRGLTEIRRILVPYLGSSHDRLALELSSRLGRQAGVGITVLHIVPEDRGLQPPLNASDAVSKVFPEPSQSSGVEFRIVEGSEPIDAVLQESSGFDLMIVGLGEDWGLQSQWFGLRAERLAAEAQCSLLLVRKGQLPPAKVEPEAHETEFIAEPASVA